MAPISGSFAAPTVRKNWGGSSGEGLIVCPSADVIDAAHTNGVPVMGTVFFPQAGHGGKIEWLDDFLTKDDAGNFPIIGNHRMVDSSQGFGKLRASNARPYTDDSNLKDHASQD